MNEPFIFIGTYRLKQGKREAYEAHVKDFVGMIEEREPQLKLFRFYFDEDAEHVTVVQVHPDAESMGVHMQVAGEHIQNAYSEFLEESVAIQIFGEPTPPVLSAMRQLSGEGVPVSIHRAFSGFDRIGPSAQPVS